MRVKACRTVVEEHSSQILGYLKAATIEHGLLINFGSYKFQIKKFAMTPQLKKSFEQETSFS